LLQNFIQGVDSSTSITGTTDSTDIASLKEALSELRLGPVNVPALHTTLITKASLTFPPDIAITKTASTTFDLSNPFTASIHLLILSAAATYEELSLGGIKNYDTSSNPITAPGHSNITSPPVPFAFNTDPTTIITLLSRLAAKNSVNLGPLVDLFKIVLANPNVQTGVSYHL
jgi:hypothetical protein